MTDPATIAAGLTDAQKKLMVRMPGVYATDLFDAVKLFECGLWQVSDTPLGVEVRKILENQ